MKSFEELLLESVDFVFFWTLKKSKKCFYLGFGGLPFSNGGGGGGVDKQTHTHNGHCDS